MKKLLLLILGCLALFPGYSQSFDYNWVAYNITSESDKTCEVTGNYGISGDIIIPEKVTYEGTEYSVTSIGEAAFYGCHGLTSVEIPNSVTSIGDEAFFWCNRLTSVTIGNSVTSIGLAAFSICGSLTSINVNNENPSYKSEGGVLYSKNLQTIIQYPAGLSGNFIIPNTVTSIGERAFYSCSSLTSIEIPNSVTSIGEVAFYSCSSLTSIEIPNSVTSIGDSAFMDCISLTSVTIGNSVTSIGKWAFADCISLTSVEIGNSVTSIREGAFYRCSSLTSVEIPNSVTSIGWYAFVYCIGLTSVEIGNSVTSIGNYAFCECRGLTSVTIPNSVTSIGDAAFLGCSSLTRVEFPNSITSIGQYAFEGCDGLQAVYNYALVPQDIDASVFNGVSINSITLYVPEESVDLYKTAETWKEFNIVGIQVGGSDPKPDPEIEFEKKIVNVFYIDKDDYTLHTQPVTLHLPVPEEIKGYTFRKWVVLAGDLDNGIQIQAQYVDNDNMKTNSILGDESSDVTRKVIRAGKIYILKGDKVYDTNGQEVYGQF